MRAWAETGAGRRGGPLISVQRPASVVFDVLLLVHVLGGFLGLASGSVPLLGVKGGEAHRRWGRVFVGAMGTAAITALPLAIWREDALQFVVGVFSGYLALYGLRILRRGRDGRLSFWEKGLGAFAAGTFLLATAASVFLWGTDVARARTAIGFSLVGLVVALGDVSSWARADRSSRARVANHMTAMVLALAAGFAAFLNTQGTRLTHLAGGADVWMLPPLALAVLGLVIAVPRRVRAMRAGVAIARPGESAGAGVRSLRRLGIVEGVSFLVLLLVAVPAKRMYGDPTLVRFLGPVHGSLVLMYLSAGISHGRSAGWSGRRFGAFVAAGLLPLGSFVFDASLRRDEESVRAASG